MHDIFDEAIQRIFDAKAGKVEPSLPLIDAKTPKNFSLNTRMRFGMGIYLLMTGPPGTGKTSFVDTHFVLNPILAHLSDDKQPKPRIVYRCMERPPVDKMVKFIAYLMWHEYGEIVDVPTLLQYSNKKRLLTETDIRQIEELRGYVDLIAQNDYIDLVGGRDTPAGVMDYMMAEAHRRGAYVVSDMEKIWVNGKEVSDFKDPERTAHGRIFKVIRGRTGREIKVYQKMNKFFPHDPNLMLIHIIDTANNVEGHDVLETLNAHTKNQAKLRDAKICGAIDIVQMGRDTEREMRARGSHLSINLKDIKGSGNFGQNADIALSILDPMYFDIEKWGPEGFEYDLKRFYGTFRLFQIFKNSHGGSLYKMPCIFLGENGYFYELPHPNHMTEEIYQKVNKMFHSEHIRKDLKDELF